MKKLLVVALIVAVGVSAGYASSMKVPWWVDVGGPAIGFPPSDNTLMGLVYLTSNVDSDLVCSITYYNETGEELVRDPAVDGGNTFVIPARSTVAFRPSTNDPNQEVIAACDPTNADYDAEFAARYTPPAGLTGDNAQESKAGVVIPDQPAAAAALKRNGSLVVEWVGGSGDLQGQYTQVGQLGGKLLSYAHLLPPGV